MTRLIIGATNTDHHFHLKAPLRMGDSNPVRDHVTFGGVGYNVAHHMRELDPSSTFITAFNRPLTSARTQTILTDHAPAYYAVMESDMVVAFAAMDALQTVPVAPFLEAVNTLAATDRLIADLNFPEAFLREVFQASKAPIWVDATSAHKAEKLHRVSPFIQGIKLNQLEASVFTQTSTRAATINALAQSPVPEIVLTLGPEGIIHIRDDIVHLKDAGPFNPLNLSGVGDAFMAGMMLVPDDPLFDMAFALAALTASYDTATPPVDAYATITPERKHRDVRILTRRPRRPESK